MDAGRSRPVDIGVYLDARSSRVVARSGNPSQTRVSYLYSRIVQCDPRSAKLQLTVDCRDYFFGAMSRLSIGSENSNLQLNLARIRDSHGLIRSKESLLELRKIDERGANLFVEKGSLLVLRPKVEGAKPTLFHIGRNEPFRIADKEGIYVVNRQYLDRDSLALDTMIISRKAFEIEEIRQDASSDLFHVEFGDTLLVKSGFSKEGKEVYVPVQFLHPENAPITDRTRIVSDQPKSPIISGSVQVLSSSVATPVSAIQPTPPARAVEASPRIARVTFDLVSELGQLGQRLLTPRDTYFNTLIDSRDKEEIQGIVDDLMGAPRGTKEMEKKREFVSIAWLLTTSVFTRMMQANGIWYQSSGYNESRFAMIALMMDRSLLAIDGDFLPDGFRNLFYSHSPHDTDPKFGSNWKPGNFGTISVGDRFKASLASGGIEGMVKFIAFDRGLSRSHLAEIIDELQNTFHQIDFACHLV